MKFEAASRLMPRAAVLGLLLYVGACGYMWNTQKEHIFVPRMLLQTRPSRLGLKFEEVHIPVGTGSNHGDLYGWWIPSGRRNAPTMLYLHGNDRNISYDRDIEKAGHLTQMGYNVLMLDYRGYGRSTGGPPSEDKVYEDAEAGWDYLVRQQDCSPKRTFIYGHSLGGAIAIDLAEHHPEAAGLITESTFTSMADMARLSYGYLPVDLLLDQRFDSIDKIGTLKIPVLFLHGTWDRLVPYRMSQQLFERAPQPKFIKLIQGGEHNNVSSIGWLEYRDTVKAFVQKYSR